MKKHIRKVYMSIEEKKQKTKKIIINKMNMSGGQNDKRSI